jgi:Na+/H+-dicarboxylate symporter
MAAENKGGAAVWIWVLIGAVVGVATGWWFDELVTYTLLATLLGWFTGLSLATPGGDAH